MFEHQLTAHAPIARFLFQRLSLACFISHCIILHGAVGDRGVTPKPNVVLILADDLGWGDLKCFNTNSLIPTPNLDRLASQGMRFTDAHSPSAVCTPTRYGIMTGRYAWRSRLKSGVLWGYSPPLIEDQQPTIATFLKNAGYQTACIGKWHLGLGWVTTKPTSFGDSSTPKADISLIDYSKPLTSGPHTLGFSYSFIIPASLDMDPYLFIENGQATALPTSRIDASKHQRQGGNGFWRAGPIAPDFTIEGCQPRLTQKAVEFIHSQSGSSKTPFFLYFPLTSPHDPWVPTREFKGRNETGERGDFVMQMDDSVGKLMTALDEIGASQNTIFIFTSDNGAHWMPNGIDKSSHQANGKWRGMKSDAFEGGHRVPFIVRWPNQIKPNTATSRLIGLNDFMATVAEINKLPPPSTAVDSVSFLNTLLGRRTSRSIPLVHHSVNGIFAIRSGHWKFIDAPGSGGWSQTQSNAPVQLYRLDHDPAETTNLALKHRSKMRELQTQLQIIQSKD